jgi:iron complex outermembrane receptor protein
MLFPSSGYRDVASPRRLVLAVCLLFWAGDADGQTPPVPVDPNQPRLQEPKPAPSPSEVVVVTASRLPELLINAPATMTVITEEAIRNAPSQSITDLLRLVPGMNAVQSSVRDVNVATRAATGTLTNSMLVLVDGRSVYQDFFGTVFWDFLSIDPLEIKQIEIIRGPASAVWGPNALTGVVNVITKTPRELAAAGTSLFMKLGLLDRTREGGQFDAGGMVSVQGLHADAPSDRFAYKISGGLLTQEAFLRPAGTVPGKGTAFEPFENSGTTQGRLDARADYDFPETKRQLVLAGGIAATEGIAHTGLGPFDIQRGSTLKYGRLTFSRDKLRIQAFVNALDAEAPVLLKFDAGGRPLHTTFENQVYDVEVANQHILGTKHLVSYGANYRHNSFDLSIAPRGDNRNEGGVYVQDHLFLSDRVHWMLGARVDLFDTLDKAVVSPRTAVIFKVQPAHSLRVSFNRSYRSPSFVNNFFDLEFFNQIDHPAAGPLRFPSHAVGNEDLRAERLTAYEAGYIGAVGDVFFGAVVYLNDARDLIQFTQVGSYTSSNPPPQWPLPPAVLDAMIAAGSGLPSDYTYLNFDRISTRGVELSVESGLTPGGRQSGGSRWLTWFANYTWQDTPNVTGFDPAEANNPPRHIVNAGVSVSRSRFFGSMTASYQDRAYWQDVLDTSFHSETSPYTVLNGCFGVRSVDGSMTVAVRGTNLLNHSTQQHVFGDLIKRTLTGEVRLMF